MTSIFPTLERHARAVFGAVALITALLVVPFLTMAPTESASTEPTGDVFTARDLVDDTFVSSVHPVFLIAEHESGNLLRAEPLRELAAAQDSLRSDADLAPAMFSYFDVATGRDVEGVLSIADLVEGELEQSGLTLESATDADVALAGATVIERYGETSDVLGLSVESTQTADGQWEVPAVTLLVLTDNDVLGFGNSSINLGGGTEVEEFDRSVQSVLREAEGFTVHGVAIDVNLTSQEQGAIAGPFIGFTILAVLLIVGLTFRSYWVLATVSSALVLLIIWLKGITHLIGLKDDLVLSLIVPIAMVSFGVDFAFHSIGRYREERETGRPATIAFGSGMRAVSAALILALVSGVVAFLANVVSGIESIIQFGVGAAIALLSAYLLLGVVSPLVVARIEAAVPAPSVGRRSALVRLGGGLTVAALAMTSVLMLVFVLPWLGVVFAAITVIFGLVLPAVVRRRSLGADPVVGDLPVGGGGHGSAARLGRVVAAVSARPIAAVGAALALTAVAATFAIRVPAEFDVNDFFASDTDFVVGLDQLDRHVGERGGEPALLYVEGPLTEPSALGDLRTGIDQVRSLDNPQFAREGGEVMIQRGVFSVLDAAWESPVFAGIVEQQTGVVLVDADGDRIPDSADQVAALLDVAAEIGVPFDADRPILTPDEVGTAVAMLDGGTMATVFEIPLVDTRNQQSITAAREALEPIADRIGEDLGGQFVQVTGGPFVREASLEATNDALQTSLPIALVLCLVVSTLFLRSVRYGLVSVVPIIMVVAWLYAFMEIAGFSINLVTATIAAVSVGIGIDFAIHFIVRYREELLRTGDRRQAIRETGEGTGLALFASALSSSIGFGLLALAPMPLFAAYGLLTALMIAMALAATLFVLPSILLLITSDAPQQDLDLRPTAEAGHSAEPSLVPAP